MSCYVELGEKYWGLNDLFFILLKLNLELNISLLIGNSFSIMKFVKTYWDLNIKNN